MKSIKLTNDTYLDSSTILHKKELLSTILENTIKLKPFKIDFDVSNVAVGEYAVAKTTYNVPSKAGMKPVGYLVSETSYGDANFVLEPHYRSNKIYAKMFVNYKGGTTELSVYGYIVYIRSSLIESDVLN